MGRSRSESGGGLYRSEMPIVADLSENLNGRKSKVFGGRFVRSK